MKIMEALVGRVEKCMMQCALNATSPVKCHFSHKKEGQFIVGTAIDQEEDTN